MADIASQFFSPWDPSPPFVAQPADQKRAEVVQKLAQFAAKNGASFVELIKTKQKDNPEYQFLFGGENFDYYRWVLFASLHSLHIDQPLPVAQQHATQGVQQPDQPQTLAVPVQDIEGMLQQTAATCPPEVTTGFSQVLAGLTGSKVCRKALHNDQPLLRTLAGSISNTHRGRSVHVVCGAGFH